MKLRNWAPITVVPLKKVFLAPNVAGPALAKAQENYCAMCAIEQHVLMISTPLSLVKFVLRRVTDLKKVASLDRRLSKTRKHFLNVERGMFDVTNKMNPGRPRRASCL